MTIFDLLFVAVFLAFVGSIATVATQAFRGRHAAAKRLLKWTLFCTASYLAVVALVALSAPQQVVPIGQDRCFDDWCIAVMGVHAQRTTGAVLYDVTLRLSSRARTVRKFAPETDAYLMDDQKRTYSPLIQDFRAPSLGAILDPLESITTHYKFLVPFTTAHLGLVVSNGRGPGWFVIGDEQNPLHKKTIVPIPALAEAPTLQ